MHWPQSMTDHSHIKILRYFKKWWRICIHIGLGEKPKEKIKYPKSQSEPGGIFFSQ